MQAILGRVTRVENPDGATTPGGADDDHPLPALKVSFKPLCVLPERDAPPEWLKDAALTLTRRVPDPREIGQEDDSLVLTPAESDAYLRPLLVTPTTSEGQVPAALQLRLRWWKDEEPPEITVRAGGREQTRKWVRVEGAKEWTATVETAPLFPFPPTLPVRFDVASGPLKTFAVALPSSAAAFHAVPAADSNAGGERYRGDNLFYSLEIEPRVHAAGVASLVEKGRGLDHFAPPPDDRIAPPLEHAGHADRVKMGWEPLGKMREAALADADMSRSGEDAARLTLQGVIEDNLRTRVVYTLFDRLPLLLMEREYRFEKPKEEKKDDRPKPKEPVDDLKPLAVGFRAAFAAERDGETGSRVLCSDGDALAVFRPASEGDYFRANGWRMADGWALVEHPRRRASVLYLLDRSAPAPNLACWMGGDTLTLEPEWDTRPVLPGTTLGVTVALAGGERCGAGAHGAWVATRTRLPEGGVLCAVVARLKDTGPGDPPTAAFRMGERTRAVPLERLALPGVGRVFVASVSFDGATFGGAPLTEEWDASVAGISSRPALRRL